jgi:hypothetical protein
VDEEERDAVLDADRELVAVGDCEVEAEPVVDGDDEGELVALGDSVAEAEKEFDAVVDCDAEEDFVGRTVMTVLVGELVAEREDVGDLDGREVTKVREGVEDGDLEDVFEHDADGEALEETVVEIDAVGDKEGVADTDTEAELVADGFVEDVENELIEGASDRVAAAVPLDVGDGLELADELGLTLGDSELDKDRESVGLADELRDPREEAVDEGDDADDRDGASDGGSVTADEALGEADGDHEGEAEDVATCAASRNAPGAAIAEACADYRGSTKSTCRVFYGVLERPNCHVLGRVRQGGREWRGYRWDRCKQRNGCAQYIFQQALLTWGEGGGTSSIKKAPLEVEVVI